jgi:mediator of replication checkpoint protein 1
MSTPGSSPRVTRAPRTYGRRKQTAPYAEENSFADVSRARVDLSPSSANASPTTSVLAEDVPPSSDDLGFGDTSYHDEDDSHDETARLDVDDDMDDVPVTSRYVRRSLYDDLAMIDQQFDNEDMHVETTGQPEASSGLLSKSADPSGPSASAPSSSRHFASPRVSPPPTTRRLVKQTRYVNDSDSEAPTGGVAQTSPYTSPNSLHPINTPNAQSSPTPPTSQEVSARAKSKGKQRSHSSADEDSDMLPPPSSRNLKGTRKTKERRMKVRADFF